MSWIDELEEATAAIDVSDLDALTRLSARRAELLARVPEGLGAGDLERLRAVWLRGAQVEDGLAREASAMREALIEAHRTRCMLRAFGGSDESEPQEVDCQG